MKSSHTLQAFAIVLVAASCSTGGGHADFDLKQVPGSKVYESEEDFAMTVVDGRYRLFNNAWNKGASTGRHRQKIFVNDDNGKSIMGWAWKWKDSSGVASYPEIQVGKSPWNGEAAQDSGFPFQVGSKRLVANYDIGLDASGSYNLAFEFWALSALPVSKDTISHEVMMWIAGERLGAAGSEVDKVTLQGNTFSVNLDKNHGDASGGSQNTWTILTLIAEKPILHGPLDFGPIVDYLVKKGHLSTRHYIANLELGNEIQRGAGTTVVRNYNVTLESQE
jgi:Glycosyl hydrolase family 12